MGVRAHGPGMAALRQGLVNDARRLGFTAIAVTKPDRTTRSGMRLREFVALGRHGTMGWMEETLDRRVDPSALWPEVKSVIVLAMNYGPDTDPLAVLGKPDRAAISVYARNRDYHNVMKGRMKEMAQRFAAASGADVKVFVDTAPVMEKALAEHAGIGWQGKHTNLVSRNLGSWLFLGEIFTTAGLAVDEPERDHCGTCRACLDICPTDAFPAPYQLDARRCISYLTIEHKGPIPRGLRTAIGNRVFGCDDCLAVCPWNKFASAATEAKLTAREDLREPELGFLLGLDDAHFRAFFTASPIKRIGRNRFMRNVLIAAGNSGNGALAPACRALLSDSSALVRGAAIWALSRLLPEDEFKVLADAAITGETDESVRDEWMGAPGSSS
jgi:epoxyqueuosine reductase